MAFSPQDVSASDYAWLLGFGLAGWAASSLPILLNWFEGTAEKRLMVIHSIIVALFASFTAFFVVRYFNGTEMLAFLSAMFAAYLGEQYIRPMATHFLRMRDPPHADDRNGRPPPPLPPPPPPSPPPPPPGAAP